MSSLPTIALLAVLSNPGQAVLLDFYADWCGPCRSMDPTVRKLVADGYPVRKINIDREKQLARQYGINCVPTFVLVAGDRELARVVGPSSYADLAGMFVPLRQVDWELRIRQHVEQIRDAYARRPESSPPRAEKRPDDCAFGIGSLVELVDVREKAIDSSNLQDPPDDAGPGLK